MTFGINMNHAIEGVKIGYSIPNPIILDSKTVQPLVFNVDTNGSAAELNALLTTPVATRFFIGTMKFSTTPVDDSASFQLQDMLNRITFYWTDSIAINSRREQFITMPIIFNRLTTTLGAKYSLCLFGYTIEFKY